MDGLLPIPFLLTKAQEVSLVLANTAHSQKKELELSNLLLPYSEIGGDTSLEFPVKFSGPEAT